MGECTNYDPKYVDGLHDEIERQGERVDELEELLARCADTLRFAHRVLSTDEKPAELLLQLADEIDALLKGGGR